jgi:hypothetical protein
MSGEKAVVTCQKYQFSENKKIGLFQPKARLDTQPPRHIQRFNALSAGDKQAILDFLRSL